MSPRTKEQFEAIREEKRSLIMNVALEHFASEGYHRTTINHIAKHAGISKGLMYNYFSSKEVLLSEIIHHSISEVASYFDTDKDGILSEDEFDLFVRRYLNVIREKASFWRLFSQVMLQKDVRAQLMKSDNPEKDDFFSGISSFRSGLLQILHEYFKRKQDRKPADFDPLLDMNIFLYTMQGFAMMILYAQNLDEQYFDKSVNEIIEMYK